MPRKPLLKDPYSIRVEDLEVGMYIKISKRNWLDHPFLRPKFLIKNNDQIAILQRSNVSEVEVDPLKSKLPQRAAAARSTSLASAPTEVLIKKIDVLWRTKKEIQNQVEIRRDQFSKCLEQHVTRISVANELEKMLLAQAPPETISGYVNEQWGVFSQDKIEEENSVNISIINNTSNALPYHHGANTAVLSVILACHLEYDLINLKNLMFGAMLHDIGLESLPQSLRGYRSKRKKSEEKLRNSHVDKGIAILQKAGVFEKELLQIVACHHEQRNGMGYRGLKGDQIPELAQIVSMCNHYDRHINNPIPLERTTPHKAIVDMYKLYREKFNLDLLAQFVSVMGVYPAGSIVKLSDDSMGMVTSIFKDDMKNPEIFLYDPDVDPRDALFYRVKDLGDSVTIKEDVAPNTLPASIRSYLNYTETLSYTFRP